MKLEREGSMILSMLILSLGILGSGFLLGKAFYYAKNMNRTVTVKGLAERDVKADLAIWEIDYREVGNDLIDINKRLQHDQELVVAFLKQNGFNETELSVQPGKVEDKLANVYSQGSDASAAGATNRYVVTTGVRIRTTHVDAVQKAYELSGNLLQQGVAIVFDSAVISPNPTYIFTNLDKIRPEILAEATRSARTIAEQFAKDSGSQLKGIQHASQGIFQIMSRDMSVMSNDWNTGFSALGTIDKKVRLVTTIDYRLK